MLIRTITGFFTLWLMSIAVSAATLTSTPLLRDSHDPVLQQQLENIIKDQGLSRAVRQRQLSFALVDITDEQHPRMAAVNGDEMIYAASLPKIAILLGAFVEIERGKLQLDTSTRESLTKMVRVSSNLEATRMLNRVGKNRVNEILQSDRFRLYDPLVNGGLWVGKEYGKAPAFKRDPLHNLSHGATALQTARFYYLLETGQLANPEHTRDMKEILSNPGIEHKFVKGLLSRPQARVYRKSGSWRQWHADSAIIESGGHKFIAVALAHDKKGGQWMSRLITPIHDLIAPSRIATAN